MTDLKEILLEGIQFLPTIIRLVKCFLPKEKAIIINKKKKKKKKKKIKDKN